MSLPEVAARVLARHPARPETVERALPAILAPMPPDQEEWRREAAEQVRADGEEPWDAERLAARERRVSQWRQRHGGAITGSAASSGGSRGTSFRRTAAP